MSERPDPDEPSVLGPAPFDPLERFSAWIADATASEPNDPNAMALATVDADGMPNVRTVLLKAYDAHGFVFYTNFESAKGRELLASRKAALLFHWKTLRRQVRVRGLVSIVSDTEADAYFATRPRQSRLGAWASQQSRPMHAIDALERAVAALDARYPGDIVPRPPHWSGFRVAPLAFEFWRDRPFRLHEREVLTRRSVDAPWIAARLYP